MRLSGMFTRKWYILIYPITYDIRAQMILPEHVLVHMGIRMIRIYAYNMFQLSIPPMSYKEWHI